MEEVLLVPEVEIEGAVRRARDLHHVVDPGRGVAELRERLAPGVEQPGERLLPLRPEPARRGRPPGGLARRQPCRDVDGCARRDVGRLGAGHADHPVGRRRDGRVSRWRPSSNRPGNG